MRSLPGAVAPGNIFVNWIAADANPGLPLQVMTLRQGVATLTSDRFLFLRFHCR